MDSSYCRGFCCDPVRVIICILFMSRNQKRCLPVLAKVHAGGTKATLIVADGIQVDLTQDNLQEVIGLYGATVLKDKKMNCDMITWR